MSGPQNLRFERSRAEFRIDLLTEIIYGGVEQVEKFNFLSKLVSEDPALSLDNFYTQSRQDVYKRALRKARRFIEVMKENGFSPLTTESYTIDRF